MFPALETKFAVANLVVLIRGVVAVAVRRVQFRFLNGPLVTEADQHFYFFLVLLVLVVNTVRAVLDFQFSRPLGIFSSSSPRSRCALAGVVDVPTRRSSHGGLIVRGVALQKSQLSQGHDDVLGDLLIVFAGIGGHLALNFPDRRPLHLIVGERLRQAVEHRLFISAEVDPVHMNTHILESQLINRFLRARGVHPAQDRAVFSIAYL